MRIVKRISALVASTMVAGSGIALGGPASAATANPLPTFGVQFHGLWGSYTDASRAEVLDVLRANGASSVRIDVSWAMLQPDSAGQFSSWGVGMVDTVINMAASRGLKPMVTLWLAPQWANGSTDERVPVTSASGLAGLTEISTWLAQRYSGVVDGWEVWNEPNSSDFMRGASPRDYAGMLRAAHAGFKAGDPAATVVFGGTMYTDTSWIKQALSAGAAHHYDVMAVHPYQGVADEPPEAADNGTQWRMRHVPTVKSAMDAAGDFGKPIWFTEFGWRVGTNTSTTQNWQRSVSEATQADYLARTLRLIAAEWPYVTRAYWYRDRHTGSDPQLDPYGLVFSDGRVRPALAQIPSLYAVPSSDPVVSDPVVSDPVVSDPVVSDPVQPTKGKGPKARKGTVRSLSAASSAIPVAQVKVKSVSGGRKLRVNVNPNMGKGYFVFKVERRDKHGRWKAKARTYRTKGRAETRTINLPRGSYRVLVRAKYGYQGSTSKAVFLRR